VITLKSKVLAAVARWAYPEFDRMHLHMVLFADGEYVACDGHRLVRVPYEYDGEPFGVDRSHLLAAIAAQEASHVDAYDDEDGPRVPRLNDKLSIECKDGRVHLTIANGVTMIVPRRDPAMYPPYDKVTPRSPGHVPPDGYHFNPRYLADMDVVNSAITGGRNSYVKVAAWSDRHSAVLFEGAEGTRFVIMPARQER
jgi:hypothetical protein